MAETSLQKGLTLAAIVKRIITGFASYDRHVKRRPMQLRSVRSAKMAETSLQKGLTLAAIVT
jgi:hypothetical protein